MECREDFLEDGIILEDMQRIDRSLPEWEILKDTSVYVTGAAGMIASYLVMFLIYLNEVHDCHIQINAGVRNADKARRRFGVYMDRDYFHLVQSDVNEPVVMENPVDHIIHAASLASPQYYGKMPVETMNY